VAILISFEGPRDCAEQSSYGFFGWRDDHEPT